DANIAFELDCASLRIDLDDREMRAEGVDEVGRIVKGGRLEAGFDPGRHVPGHVRHQGDVLDGLRVVGRALHEELAILVVHVFDGGFEQVGGDDLRLVADLAGGDSERGAADGGGAAAVGAPTHRRIVSVSVDDLDVF